MMRVNHPLTFHGLRFYQESYFPQYSGMVTVTDGRHTQSVRVHTGDVMELNGGSLHARVQQIGTDLMRMGPALLLELQDAGGARRLWLFQGIADIKQRFPDLYARVPEFNPARMPPYIFTLDSVATTYATGLGVRHDPGAPLVAVGAVLFFLGLLCVFLIPERRLWIRLEPSDGSVTATVWETHNHRPVHPPCRWLATGGPRRTKP
jgi:cytochrome c biogenesis protein